MFFSLIQTLVCVLLINGGLYALHLTGNGNGNGSGNSGGAGGGGGGVAPPSGQIGPSSQKPLDSSGRLTEELADMAQLERERLMLQGLAKQTAAAGMGHHGRPIITGRIQMRPAEDLEGDYPALLMQQARGFMFGNVVKQPAETDDYEAAEDYDGGGLGDRRRPVKYEYGRVVQPSDREYEPQHMDVDDFLELEAEPEVEDMLPDLDGYQYLDEILAERHRGWGGDQATSNYGSHHGYHAGHAQNAFQTLEELEAHPQQTLLGLFDKERHEVAAKVHQEQEQQKTATAAKHRNGPYNIHLQQKWQRKRAQQQQQQQQLKQWQRNIFGQQKQPHHYGAQHSKLSMANSEATATKHIDKPSLSASAASSAAAAAAAAAAMQSSSSLLSAPALSVAALNAQNGRSAQQSDRQQSQSQAQAADSADGASAGAAVSLGAASAAAKTAAKLNVQQQLKPDKFLHPNRKRSGGVSAAATGGYSAGMQSPVTHSIASQLMLRTARGQRQYDVPQIECPTAMDGMERFACPTPDLQGRYRCIDDHVLCDGFIDCPEGEDEDRRSCMFYKTTKAHLDVLADALLRWARGR